MNSEKPIILAFEPFWATKSFQIAKKGGKTTFCLLLKAVFGMDYMIFFSTYAEYEDAFNACLNSRLWWFIDDITQITRKQSLNLNSRASASEMKFNEKNESCIFIKSFLRYFNVLTNDKNIFSYKFFFYLSACTIFQSGADSKNRMHFFLLVVQLESWVLPLEF